MIIATSFLNKIHTAAVAAAAAATAAAAAAAAAALAQKCQILNHPVMEFHRVVG